jgi:hypothetical protein
MVTIMASRLPYTAVFIFFFLFSCSNKEQVRGIPESDILNTLPPKQEIPILRILDYKNKIEGAVVSLWLRKYLENGIAEVEILDVYRGSYLFISSIRSVRLPVINQWMLNYKPEKNFSRLVAERIQKRLEKDLPGRPPDKVYGPNYSKAVKSAYQNVFWGSMQLDDIWAFAIRTIQDEDAGPERPYYWGFILVGIPREMLEIQVNELLSKVPGSAGKEGWAATKEQNAAFDHVRGHFFEQF